MAKRITFGTAGLRATMKAGFAFMNDLTVIQTTQGLCVYLEKVFGKDVSRGVAVGYDGRHNSRRFAELVAEIFLSRSIPVYLFSDVVPTPVLAFSVTDLKCIAGVMITASHNPKDDNGYKLYWQNGCQIRGPEDVEISKEILANLQPWLQHNSQAWKSSPQLSDPIEGVGKHYFEKIQTLCYKREVNQNRGEKIVYTAMHGVGRPWAARAFSSFGLHPFIDVPAQMKPDPDFPTIPFPNPEEGKGALKMSMEVADGTGARIIVANDPDADRLALAEKLPTGEWKIFTGNEIGIILGNWAVTKYLEAHPGLDKSKCVVINSTVSSKMLKALADRYGIRYDETLTGFKWLGNAAYDYIQNGYHFIFAFEEAIGYMVGDVGLDKDGVRGAAILGELANHLYSNGSTFDTNLTELYKMLGYHASNNRYFFCYDPNKLEAIFGEIRNGGQYFPDCGGYQIKHIRDLTTGLDTSQPDKKPRLPVSRSTHMITFYFENGSVVTLRGSGTEPKLKWYSELAGPYEKRDEVKGLLDSVVQAVITHFLKPEKYDLKPAAD